MTCCIKRPHEISKVTFGIPKDEEEKKKWEVALGVVFKKSNRVCSNHFYKEDINSAWTSGSTNPFTVCLKRWQLKKGALPFIHPIKKIESDNIEDDPIEPYYSDLPIQFSKIQKIELIDDHQSLFQHIFHNMSSVKLPSNWFSNIEIFKNEYMICFHTLSNLRADLTRYIEKQLFISNDSNIILLLNGKQISPLEIDDTFKEIDTLNNFQILLDKVNITKCCQGAVIANQNANIRASFGAQYVKSSGQWRHSNCLTIIKESDNIVCSWCKRLTFSIQRKCTKLKKEENTRVYFSPNKKKIVQTLQKAKAIIKKRHFRASRKIIQLENQLNKVKNEMSAFGDKELNEIFERLNISNEQSELIKEIFAAAKVKNPKNRRYSENWMMLCLLFQIRSPCGYKFLLEQKILPLPCVNTLRNHLLAIKVGCGFDDEFFGLLKKKFSNKTDHQKKVILVFDEIFLRESISVNTRTLTYLGLEDFGKGFESRENKKANHALVLMIQSLADNVHMPIAVFASNGSIKGVDLAKIVVKSILLLENAEIQVMGMTSDGATTNRNMWSWLGISAKSHNFKNSFENPFDSQRSVYVFSDAPHLMKTIRNRLYTKKTLKIHPTKSFIKWKVYEDLYTHDSKNITRVCPRLTKNHFELNNFSKMKVKFAVQVFSKSVANGITFYKNKQFSGFDDSDETIQFTLLINNLFDALNRKYPLEGIRKSSKDLEVLKYALTWLDEWHANLTKNLIGEDEFLTISTAEGLKITIKSTIDLVEYLLNECGFEYVLSAKINQDCLEKFFGIIRQVAGPNDHPSTPSFLQLYRMLSVYCVIKPPKAGNCTILDGNTSPISVVDLKSIITTNNETCDRKEKIEKLKNQIDVIVEDGQWELDDIFEDHDYYQTPQSTVFECVVYFLAGYLTKRLKKSTKCEICIKSLNTEYGKSTNKAADLVNLKTRGFLTHPNNNLFLIIQQVELCFEKYADSSNPFENTFEDFFQNENRILTFPCKEHKVEILTNIFVIYITMRMRQFSYMKNQESKKQNKTKKKLSKLMST